MEFSHKANVSIITAILSPNTAMAVIEGLFDLGEQNALLINARGTLVRDRWFQHFLPVISPELDYLQFLVPDPEVDQIFASIVEHGKLNRHGSGAVYSVPCEEVEYGPDFSLWSDQEDDADNIIHDSEGHQENLTAIFCIAQKDQVEAISRAAMQAGAHGPVVFYAEGRGLRDRLGWLRITKGGQKEVVSVIVDNSDKIAVTEAMIDAGRLEMPGRGFLFRMPVQKGIINLPTTMGNRGYHANMQQVVAAIDGLKGSTEWRDQSVIELGATGKSAGLSLNNVVSNRQWLLDQECLGCIVSRDHAQLVIDAMLAAGAKGASVSYARFIEVECKITATGVRFNRESGFIRCVLERGLVEPVKASVKRLCEAQQISDICIFEQPVTRGYTYMAPASKERADRRERMYRGASVKP